MAPPNLADAAVVGRAKPGLADARVEAEVADQLLRTVEAGDVAYRRHQPGRHRQVDAGDRQQPVDRHVLERALGDVAVEVGEVLAQPVELADMARDRRPLILRQRLARQPLPAAPIEEIGVRALRDQVCMEDRVDLVLQPCPVADDLVASRRQPALPLRICVRRPDLRQVASGIEACQNARVDLVGLHVGMGDRLHLQADWRSPPAPHAATVLATPPCSCRLLRSPPRRSSRVAARSPRGRSGSSRPGPRVAGRHSPRSPPPQRSGGCRCRSRVACAPPFPFQTMGAAGDTTPTDPRVMRPGKLTPPVASPSGVTEHKG